MAVQARIPKSFTPKTAEIERAWFVVDAQGKTLGRLASDVAYVLKGKHKPIYATHMDTGDYVIVINANKITVTGKRAVQKVYVSHSGYPGGLREKGYQDVMNTHPERIIEHAIRGMLPKNTMGRDMYRKLKVYAGPLHPHQGQMPRSLDEVMTTATRFKAGGLEG